MFRDENWQRTRREDRSKANCMLPAYRSWNLVSIAMFSFGKKDTQVDATPKIRRLVDLTTPNRPVIDDARGSRRYNRTIPVVITEWIADKGPCDEHFGIGFTSDLSDLGFGIITQHRPKSRENVIAFYLPEDMDVPWYFRVILKTYRKQTIEFHKLGYEVVEFLNDRLHGCNKMNSLVYELLNPANT